MKTEFNLTGGVCVCVCVGWSLCSSGEIHQDRPHIHTIAHLTFTQTYREKKKEKKKKEKSHVFLSSVKAMILYLGYLWHKSTINKPQPFRQAFKIVIFLLILYRLYILFTHWTACQLLSVEATQNFANIHWCSHVCCRSVLIPACFHTDPDINAFC